MLYGYGIGFLGYFTSSLSVPSFRLRDLLTLFPRYPTLSSISRSQSSVRARCASAQVVLLGLRLESPSLCFLPLIFIHLSHVFVIYPQSFLALLLLLTPLLPSFAILFLDLSYLCLLISLFSSCYPQLLFVLLLYLCLLSRVLSLVARCRLPVLFCLYVLSPFLFSIPLVRTFNLFYFSHYPLRLLSIPCCTLILARVHDFTAVRSWCLYWCLSLAGA